MSTKRRGPSGFWLPLHYKATRKEAWKLAQAINSEQGGVRELSVPRAMYYGQKVNLSDADLEYLEVLTGADGGNVRPPPGPVPEQDPPEVKAAVETAKRERLKEEVTSKVNAALAKRQMDAAAPAGESSTATTQPAPSTAPAATEPGETHQSELPTMQEDVPAPSPVLSGRRVRADSIHHIRERTAQRSSAPSTPTAEAVFTETAGTSSFALHQSTDTKLCANWPTMTD
ncbi:MAG: hypothetical protein Q9191_004308 [Dirinaria sp. TL-2023a]